MQNDTDTACSGQHRCRRWRICDRCAAIRAAQIADRAEYLQHRFGRLALAVAKPAANTQDATRHLRDRLARAALAPAGIWTIETGELYAGLHLNLLVPDDLARARPGQFEYIEPIRTSARAAAAYIAKRKGMPSPQQYDGRLFGEWGRVTEHLMRSTEPFAAPAQAAALQLALAGPRSVADYYKTPAEMAAKVAAQHEATRPKTRAEYADIARRNLSAVYMAIKPKP